MNAPENTATDHMHLCVGSDFSDQEKVVDEAQAFAQKYIEDDEAVYEVVLATSEAVTNAMKHGNLSNPDKHVLIDFYAYADRLEVCVEDEGDGFDRKTVKNPLADENLLRAHGRGLYLIETLADEVAYEEKGRRICMTFRR